MSDCTVQASHLSKAFGARRVIDDLNFEVAPGDVTQLLFIAQPITSTAGVSRRPGQVAAHVALGNTVLGFAEAVTLTIGTIPGWGTLAGTSTELAVAGVATFSTLSFDKID